MRKFLFNINSTDWFKTIKGRTIVLEVLLMIVMPAVALAFGVITYEAVNGLDFSWRSKVAAIPFLIIGIQWVIYSAFGKPVTKEIEDHFWKTQLWRFKNPRYARQKFKYNEKYNMVQGVREKQLTTKWEYYYGETPEETYAKRSKIIQKFRMWIAIAVVLLVVVIVYNFS